MFGRTETFSPVLFATLLMCLGWVLILPPRAGTISLLQDNLSPDKLEALKYAFLGAYAFTLQDLMRRYFRDDLRAGAYLGLIVRLVFTGLIVTAAVSPAGSTTGRRATRTPLRGVSQRPDRDDPRPRPGKTAARPDRATRRP